MFGKLHFVSIYLGYLYYNGSMKNKTPKMIKYRLRTASQWLLIGLLTTSTALPGISTIVTASTEEPNVSQAIDTDTNEEIEEAEQIGSTKNLEPSDTSEETDGEGKETTADSVQITPQESAAFEKDIRYNTKSGNDIASGTFGTSDWYITASNELHIGSGTFTNEISPNASPWIEYKDEIKKVIFDGPVYVTGDSALFRMMENIEAVENIELLDTSGCTVLQGMFQKTKISNLNLSNLKTDNVTSFSSTFCDMPNITSLDLSGMNTSNLTSLFVTFSGSSKLEELNLSSWDTSNVTSWTYAFRGTTLKKITLGSKTILNPQVALPEVDVSSGQYNGRWIGLNSGNYYSSSTDFMTNYDGSVPDTYIWDQTALEAFDSTIYIGDEWKPQDNIDIAIGREGNPLNIKDIEIIGNVDTSKEGKYEVIYKRDGIETKAEIEVIKAKEDLSHITVHDSDLKVGDNWTPEDNFDEATDFEGKVEKFSDIIVEGSVDTKKAGAYEVTYTIPKEHWSKSSSVEGVHSATAKIVVSKEDKETDGSGSESNNSGNNTGSSDKDSSLDNGVLLTNVQNNQEQIKQKNQILPQTGEHFSAIAFMAGLSLLVLGSLFAVLRFKKNK